MTSTTTDQEYVGAKLAILTMGGVVTLLRDDVPHIPFPNTWDLPGGGREGNETPLDCALRETREELNLSLPREAVVWRRVFPSVHHPGRTSWFFVAEVAQLDMSGMRIGDEGQRWMLMPVEAFLNHDSAVPYLQARLQVYFDERRKRV